MKVLIDIPDKEYQACVRRDANMTGGIADNYIANGTPYEERPQGEWIPVSKSWPAFTGLYLVSIDDLVTVANFTGAYFINKRGLMLNVSAWQLLPEPYKKGSAE